MKDFDGMFAAVSALQGDLSTREWAAALRVDHRTARGLVRLAGGGFDGYVPATLARNIRDAGRTASAVAESSGLSQNAILRSGAEMRGLGLVNIQKRHVKRLGRRANVHTLSPLGCWALDRGLL